MFKINDKLRVYENNMEYKYTINIKENKSLGILDVTNIFNKTIRQVLVFLETKGAYVDSCNGVVFFKIGKDAEDFLSILEEQLETKYYQL